MIKEPTTTTIRRGDLVTLPDGQIDRVLSTRGGYVFCGAGTFDPRQLSRPDLSPTAARAFLETQTVAMRAWDNSALPNRKEHELALAYIAALLKLRDNEEGTKS